MYPPPEDPPKPRILNLGDCALTVEFAQTIAPEFSAKVQALDHSLSQNPIAGIIETVPTYRALLVIFDPDVVAVDALKNALTQRLSCSIVPTKPRHYSIPACYDPPYSQDLHEVAQLLKIPAAEVIRLHLSGRYHIAMYGFAPGWAYLSGCPQRLAIPRRPTPRAEISPGSLMIAGGQALIAATAMPTGWYVIAQTPERFFRPEHRNMFPFAVGSEIRFYRVNAQTFRQLEKKAAQENHAETEGA